jgi:hypothetical protein
MLEDVSGTELELAIDEDEDFRVLGFELRRMRFTSQRTVERRKCLL